MYSIQLRHPFGLLVSGGTKSGKTTFVKKLLTYVDIMIEKPSENITYYYSEFQNTFGEIQTLVCARCVQRHVHVKHGNSKCI